MYQLIILNSIIDYHLHTYSSHWADDLLVILYSILNDRPQRHACWPSSRQYFLWVSYALILLFCKHILLSHSVCPAVGHIWCGLAATAWPRCCSPPATTASSWSRSCRISPTSSPAAAAPTASSSRISWWRQVNYLYTYCICILCLYTVFVYCSCRMYLYTVFVYCVCILYLYTVVVECICIMY